jgi:hypothetical protein
VPRLKKHEKGQKLRVQCLAKNMLAWKPYFYPMYRLRKDPVKEK